MGYSVEENMVRVDFFKESGKWYITEEMKWYGWDATDIFEAFRYSLNKAFPKSYKGMQAICLEPYHKNAFPISLKHYPNG